MPFLPPNQRHQSTEGRVEYTHGVQNSDDVAPISECRLSMVVIHVQQVLPKVIWEQHISTPHGRDWTCLLHAQYPLQTNPITKLRVRYIYTTMSHVSYTLHCVSCPIPLSQKKKFAPSLAGDIHTQSSHWNNGKWKLPIILLMSRWKRSILLSPSKPLFCMSIFVPTSKKLLCRMPNIKVQADYFLPIMSDCTLIASKQSIGYGR